MPVSSCMSEVYLHVFPVFSSAENKTTENLLGGLDLNMTTSKAFRPKKRFTVKKWGKTSPSHLKLSGYCNKNTKGKKRCQIISKKTLPAHGRSFLFDEQTNGAWEKREEWWMRQHLSTYHPTSECRWIEAKIVTNWIGPHSPKLAQIKPSARRHRSMSLSEAEWVMRQ